MEETSQKSCSVASLLQEISQALKSGLPPEVTPLAAFDADGTLWSGDLGLSAFRVQLASPDGKQADDVANKASKLAGVGTEAAPKAMMQEALVRVPLQQWAGGYGISEQDSLSALHAVILQGIDDGSIVQAGVKQGHNIDNVLADIYAMHAWSYVGLTEAKVVAHGAAVYAQDFKALTYPSTHRLLPGLKALGVRCIIVSASPELILRSAAADLGIAAEDTFGMATASGEGGVVLAPIRRLVHGLGKADLVRDLIGDGQRPLLAFGDSVDGGDKELLALAEIPVAVAPAGRHLHVARAQGMRILDPSQNDFSSPTAPEANV